MNRFFFFTAIFAFLIAFSNAVTADSSVVIRGKWGKEVDQLGIVYPNPGVMPTAPYMCIGGFDKDKSGRFWFTDSINRMLKCYDRKKWSYIMMNAEKLGDIICYENLLYVITRSPDGVTIVDPESGKILETIKLPFANPGRLRVFTKDIIAVEEPGKGLWLKHGDKVYMHPAVALEAVSDGKHLYGVQYSFEAESRSIIAAEISQELQEPDVLTVYDAGEEIIFSKLAGMVKQTLVLSIIKRSKPETISFIGFEKKIEKKATIDLKILEGPFLPTTSWKLCSDNSIYGFYGTASEGFRLYKSNSNF